MGVVVQATHLVLKDRVAIKLLRRHLVADDHAVARFVREAQSAARIKSPYVARVVDVGTMDNGSPYLVMEFLEGSDLGAIVEKKGPMPLDTALRCALQTCEALAAAHASGVIHRDIKPGNLFLTRGQDGVPALKVLDFGISKVVEPLENADLTQTQRSMGSPFYMSPEQMRSARKVDVRTDIWSLGTVMYEIITGVPPFVAETIPELYALVLDKESRPTPMMELRPEVPPELNNVVQICLSKDPAGRYANVAEVAAALSLLAGPEGEASAVRTRHILETAGLLAEGVVKVPPVPSVPPAAAKEGASTATSFGHTGRVPNTIRRRTLTYGAGALAVAAAVVSASVWMTKKPAPVGPESEPAMSPDAFVAPHTAAAPGPLPGASATTTAAETPSASASAGASAQPVSSARAPTASARAPAAPSKPAAAKAPASPDSVLLNRK
jgi:serine/threonine-protein kinase